MKRIFFAVLLVILSALVYSWAYNVTSPNQEGDKAPSLISMMPFKSSTSSEAAGVPMHYTSGGAYLASRAAQHRNDWRGAATFLEQALDLAKAKALKNSQDAKSQKSDTDTVLTGPHTLQEALSDVIDEAEPMVTDGVEAEIQAPSLDEDAAAPNNLGGFLELKQRVLIFQLGSGHYEEALKEAQDIMQAQKDFPDEKNAYDRLGFAQSVLVIEAFRKGDYEAANEYLKNFSPGAVSDSLKPLFDTWAQIALKEADKKTILKQSHLMPLHAIYALEFADYVQEAQMLMERFNMGIESPASKLALAVFYARHDQMDKGEAIMKDMVARYPDDVEIVALYEDMKAKDNVAKNPTYRLLSMHTNSLNHALAISLYDMAGNHLSNGSEETALLLGQLAYGLVQDVSQINFLLADILTRRENYEQSLAILESVPENDPGYTQSVIARAEIYSEIKQQDKAYDILEHALTLKKDVDVAYTLAGLFRSDEKYEEALKRYNDVEEFAGGVLPDRLWSVHYYRGIIYNEIGDWDKSEVALFEARDARPENPYVLNYLAYSWVEMNENVDEALLILQKALSLEPQSGFITDSVGWAYFKINDYDEAIVYLERAAELMPYDPEVNDHLGDAYWKVGRKLEAYYQWNRAIKYADPDDEHHTPIVKQAQEKMETGL